MNHEALASKAADAVGVTPHSDMRLFVEQAVKWAFNEAALSAAEPISSIVPDHCSGAALIFEGGCLHVRKDGSGHIAVDEDDFKLEDDRCEGEHGPEGSVHWIARFPAGEMTELRNFLNGQDFPTPPAPSVDALPDVGKWTDDDRAKAWRKAFDTMHRRAMKAESALSAQVQAVADGKELGRFELWFFHRLSDDQRTALFALNGYPTTGMDTHGKQKIALKHWFSRLPAAPAKQEGGE